MNLTRELQLSLRQPPAPAQMDALRQACGRLQPEPGVTITGTGLHITYAFPGVTLADLETALAATVVSLLTPGNRWRLLTGGMLELNEIELHRAGLGWRACLDRIHGLLATPGRHGARRQHWQDYERRQK